METNIRKCVEALEKLEKKFSYGEIETAIYIRHIKNVKNCKHLGF